MIQGSFEGSRRRGVRALSSRAALLVVALLVSLPVAAPAQVLLSDPARNWTLRIGGIFQYRYEFLDTPDEDLTSFYFRRLRLDFTGQIFSDRLTYRVYPEFAREAALRDGWINYRFGQMLEMRLGQMPVPFQFRIAPARQVFIENPAASLAFGHSTIRDLGILFSGADEAGIFAWTAGVFDGSGVNTRRSNSAGHLGTGRVAWAPRGLIPVDEADFARTAENLAFGLGVMGATDNGLRDWDLGRSNTGNREADWIAVSGDVQLQQQGLSVFAVGYHRSVAPSDPAVASYTGLGWDIGGSYMLVPERFDVAIRHSRHNRDRDASDTREVQWQGAMSLYRNRHLLKTTLYVESNRYELPLGSRTERIAAAQVQLQF